MEAAGEKQPEARYILKVELMGFTIGLHGEGREGKEGPRMTQVSWQEQRVLGSTISRLME